jgi:hypothetical protein
MLYVVQDKTFLYTAAKKLRSYYVDSVCVQSRMHFPRKSSSFISHMILCPGIEVVMDSQSTQKRLEYIVSDKKLFYLFFCRYRLLNYVLCFGTVVVIVISWLILLSPSVDWSFWILNMIILALNRGWYWFEVL